MFWFLSLPLPVRLLIIALVGAWAGSFANWAIYSFAWFNPRAISPWSTAPAGLARSWSDRLPILGWFGLRRESQHFGAWHWVRPLLIELGLSLGLALLYATEVSGALLPSAADLVAPPPELTTIQFLSHAILIWLMTVATFIDFDEKTIPDLITIPGTLLGLLLTTIYPTALPPIIFFTWPNAVLQPLWITAAKSWPDIFNQWPGLLLGLVCLCGWCYAMIPKLCTMRRGLWKGIVYLNASTFRGSAWWQLGLIALVGSIAIATVWSLRADTDTWKGLLSSLVGMAFGGGMIWSVRIVGYVALRKEAMGFGDVTLMAMIGSFLGWQPMIFVFFLAPMAAVVIALAQWLATGRRDIPFGPYLCAGALILILYWAPLWAKFQDIFELGGIIPAILFALLLLMLGLLMLIRIAEETISRMMGRE